ncbi:MAG: hypothetical protein ACI4TF_04300 [Oliverpabstia sp.]
MKKRVLKMVALTLSASMLMAACGKSDSENGGSDASTNETATSETTTGFNETGYPIVDEPITLKVLAAKHQLSDPFEEQQTWIELEEKTGINIEWEYITPGSEDWGTQKSLLLTSGELPDIFLGETLTESDVIQNSDLFINMTEYIEKYCPNIQNMFDDSDAMKKMSTAPDGNIYGLAYQKPCRPYSFDMAFINQIWLDNLGLEIPTTLDEFENVLKAFKEQDANGNGDPNDEIPLSFMGFTDLTGCLSLYASFGEDVVDSMGDRYLSVTDGDVAYIPVLDNFKEGTKWLQKLYQEGLIDVEAFTQDWSIYPAKLNPEGDSTVGVAFHWTRGNVLGEERSKEYSVLMPLEGPNGERYWRQNPDYVKAGKYHAEVTASCKYPEVAMRLIDALYDEEVSMQLFYGAIGVTMEKNDDGTYTVLDAPEDIDPGTWEWKYSMADYMTGYVSDEMSDKISPALDVRRKLEADKAYSEYFKDEYYPLVNLSDEQSDELSTLATDLNGYWKQTVSEWIVNGGDIDAEWDAYVAQMEAMGSDRYEEIYQEAYDAYMGN